MYEREKQQLIDCARAMERHGLVVLSGGNVSMRMPCGNFLVTPSAMSYDTMTIDDIVLIDGETRTVEGRRRPTSDKHAVLYMFRHMPEVNVILHTHQPYATAVGLVSDRLPANLVTVIDELHGEVKVAPFTPLSLIQISRNPSPSRRSTFLTILFPRWRGSTCRCSACTRSTSFTASIRCGPGRPWIWYSLPSPTPG